MFGLKRWQLIMLLLIGTAMLVKCHKEKHESGFEEDGGEEDKEDHFDEESHKGDKGFHKKCLLLPAQMEDSTIMDIIELADILEKCDFELFWSKILGTPDMIVNVKGFFDSIRKFVCNVVNITFQNISSDYLKRLLGGIDDNGYNHWVKKYGWKDQGDIVVIAKQEESIKTKNITEKIEFSGLSRVMTNCL